MAASYNIKVCAGTSCPGVFDLSRCHNRVHDGKNIVFGGELAPNMFHETLFCGGDCLVNSDVFPICHPLACGVAAVAVETFCFLDGVACLCLNHFVIVAHVVFAVAQVFHVKSSVCLSFSLVRYIITQDSEFVKSFFEFFQIFLLTFAPG